MIHDQTQAQALLDEVIAIRNAQQREIAELRRKATGCVPVYALAIGDFPPNIRHDPMACLRFALIDMMHVVKPNEFDSLTPGELKQRAIACNGFFEMQKEYWNEMVAEIKAGIAAVGDDAHAGRVAAERLDNRVPTPRADKKSKHRKRKIISGAWRSAADVAEDFNKAAFMPKGGKRKLGTCDVAKINRWDAECPDYEHKNKWGYYAQLRVDSNLKNEYVEVVARWVEHWNDYKRFGKQHPGVKFRPMRRTDIDTARMGRDEQGDLVTEPRTDQERKNRRR